MVLSSMNVENVSLSIAPMQKYSASAHSHNQNRHASTARHLAREAVSCELVTIWCEKENAILPNQWQHMGQL